MANPVYTSIYRVLYILVYTGLPTKDETSVSLDIYFPATVNFFSSLSTHQKSSKTTDIKKKTEGLIQYWNHAEFKVVFTVSPLVGNPVHIWIF